MFLLIFSAGSEGEITVANSIDEFSGVQGQDGWHYGFAVSPFTSADFSESGTFQGSRWAGVEGWFIGSSIGLSVTTHRAVRRWVSNVSGQIELDLVVRKINLGVCSDGEKARLLVDGVEVFSYTISSLDGVGVRPTVMTTVSVGSVIDLQIDPLTDNCGDGSEFSAVIRWSGSGPDSDGDGLLDDEETVLGTNVSVPDTDGDGLNDFDEHSTYGTNPLELDTDGDSYGDGEEVTGGFDPLDPRSFPGAEDPLPLLSSTGGANWISGYTNQLLFAGAGNHVRVLDVSSPATPTELGRLVMENTVVGDFGFIGNYAYLADASELYVLDATDPSRPTLVTSRFLGGTSPFGTFVASVIFRGNRAYVFAGDAGIFLFDVTLPTDPKLVTVKSLGTVVSEGRFRGDYLHVVGIGGMWVFHAPSPDELTLVGHAASPFPVGRIEISGDVAYVTATQGGFRVIDVSDPTNPVEIGVNATGTLDIDIEVVGTVGYVAASQDGLRILDLSDPANPQEVAVLSPSNFDARMAPTRLELGGNYLYINAGNDGTRVLDISSPLAPVEVGHYREVFGSNRLAVTGNHAFVASSSQGLQVVDISDLERLRVVAEYIPGALNTQIKDVYIDGDLAYVAALQEGLRILDISNPENPSELSATDTGLLDVFRVVVEGPYAYLTGNGPFKIFDVSDAGNPIEIGSHNVNFQLTDGVAVLGSYVFVGDQTGTMLVMDVSDASTPTIATSLSLGGEIGDIEIDGNHAYVASTTGLHIVDISDPLNPAYTSTFAEISPIQEVTVKNDSAYLASGNAGLTVVFVGNPANPVATRFIDTPGFTNGVELANVAIVADNSGGLHAIPVPPDAPELSPFPPPFINADSVTVSGTVLAGSFVTAGGGAEPQYQQLADGVVTFSIPIELKQEAVNTLSVTTMNEFGLVSLPAVSPVVEGIAFPSTIETVTTLTVTPDPAPSVAINDSLAFTCEATFSDASTADVTEYVKWEEIVNGEVITEGGLYVNTAPGSAQVRAFVAGVLSNVVTVTDGP